MNTKINATIQNRKYGFDTKVGANAGPSGELGSKVIWDHTNKILQFGVNGKFIGGGEIEGQIKF